VTFTRQPCEAVRVTTQKKTALGDGPTAFVAQRILDEGAKLPIVAAHDAGLHGQALPSLKTLLRAAKSRRLDAVKIAGRWLTSAAAIRRWVDAQQGQARSISGLANP
jgi:hypothetical protein